MTHFTLTTAQRDRAAGVLVGQACGDALGVPYEFGSPLSGQDPEMIGGGLGPYAPGEWSDDTQMAVCIAQVTAELVDRGATLDDDALGRIARAFSGWLAYGASDVGNQTRAVINAAGESMRRIGATPSNADVARAYRDAAHHFTATSLRSAGNGALMRNGIVGVTALDDRELTAANARRVAELTHADPLVLDSCVLHAEAVRRGVLTGEYDLLAGLDLLPEERRGQWVSWLESATRADASTIEANGSTFGALRAAHAAITSAREASRGRDGEALLVVRAALETAASAGHDTDTVAAITGALLGSVYGVSAIPATWRRRIHGWPGLRARDLVELALRTAGEAPADAWPRRAHEPEVTSRPAVTVAFDGGLQLGTQSCLTTTDADAVVSLSRIGSAERLFADHPERHVEFWLVDSDDPATHNDLAATLIDAADVVAELRSQRHNVLLHCVHAHHRTPSVALVYAVKYRWLTTDAAAEQIRRALGVSSIDGLLWQTALEVARAIEAPRVATPATA